MGKRQSGANDASESKPGGASTGSVDHQLVYDWMLVRMINDVYITDMHLVYRVYIYQVFFMGSPTSQNQDFF